MRTPIEALKEIRDRLTYFCLRTDGKYDPPWATELVGIIDEAVTYSHAVGNAAAMREAVETALTTIRGVINGTIARTNNSVFDCRDRLKAALAASARNCDRYKTAEDAYDAFDEITHADIEKYDECRQNCPMCDEKLYIPCEVKWLFAPATERKGEGDGN